jgi:hypothetical protein
LKERRQKKTQGRNEESCGLKQIQKMEKESARDKEGKERKEREKRKEKEKEKGNVENALGGVENNFLGVSENRRKRRK